MKEKKSLIIYYDYLETIFSELTDAEIGQLLVAAIIFDREGLLTTFEDRTVKTAYNRMISDCENNYIKYVEMCKKNKENIEKRWQNKAN